MAALQIYQDEYSLLLSGGFQIKLTQREGKLFAAWMEKNGVRAEELGKLDS